MRASHVSTVRDSETTHQRSALSWMPVASIHDSGTVPRVAAATTANAKAPSTGTLTCTYGLADSEEEMTVQIETKPTTEVTLSPEHLPRLTGYEAYVWSQRIAKAIKS